ncbi:M23/M56 family metallopeptidase [Agaribacter marinus]|nr:M23/M56 family metallopeptidase [Agaribacter marinus]
MDSSVIQFIVNSVFPWLLFSSVVYVCSSYLTKRNNISPNIWWFTLFASFLPFIPFSVDFGTITIPHLEYINSSLENAQVVKQASITHASLNNADLIAIALIFMYLCFTCIKLARLMAVWQKLTSISHASELINALPSYKAKVAISSHNHSPFVFGVTTPQIILPHYFNSLEKEQQSILLKHELTHIANNDHIAILLWRILSTLMWINPFIKKMEWQFIRAIEHRCDKHTICRFNLNKYDYAKTLLQSLKRSTQFDSSKPVAQFNSGALCADDYKTRLTNIVGSANTSHLKLTITFCSAILVITGLYMFIKESAGTDKLTWQPPLKGHTVSSPFRSVDKIRNYKPHQGVDYITKNDSSVLSVAEGIVVVADNKTLDPNYGNTVVIQHKGGYQSLYSHLKSIKVKAGTWVSSQQDIGVIGKTGKTTGVHLHFEIIRDNQRIDPSVVFNTNI